MFSRAGHLFGAASAIIVAVAAPATAKPAQSPTLAETLSWIESTYNSHERDGGSFGYGLYVTYNVHGDVFRRRTQQFAYRGCDVTLTTQDDPNAILSRDLYSETTTKFNLRDIDLKSLTLTMTDSHADGMNCKTSPVTMTCDQATLTIETTNQRPLMSEHSHSVFPKLTGKDHDNIFDNNSFVMDIYLSDVAYARRFEKAFRHAITLCGGTKSPF